MLQRTVAIARGLALVFGFTVGLPSWSTAQTPGPLVTDRPDQTESTAIVPPGYVQLELGNLLAGADSTEMLTIAPALLRIGVAPRVEARIGFAGWVRTSVTRMASTSSESGIGSLDLGFKVQVAEGNGLTPSVALLGKVLVPIGTEGVRAERADPGIRIAVSHVLSERVGVGYNVGVEASSVDRGDGTLATEAAAPYTLAVGVGLVERVGMFVEGFGSVGLSDGVASSHLFDAGFTLQLATNVQLDTSGGVRWAGDADDWFVGLGLSVRVPR